MLDWDDWEDSLLLKVAVVCGLYYIGSFLFRATFALVVGFRSYVWSRIVKKDFVKEYGKWAVVTGSTDGIGKCYAQELAKRGVNIVLISRTMEKLQRVAKEIAGQYGVEVDVIQADFSHGRQIYANITEQLKGKEIGILVNNVGVLHPHPMMFEDVTEDSMWSHVNVNVGAIVAMTKIVLPEMLCRKKGAIVNFASVAARGPLPWMQVYSATKVFDEYFSEALRVEYADSGITVQTVTPSYVSTNMTAFLDEKMKQSPLVPDVVTYVASAVSTLGYSNNTTGYWLHGIQAWLIDNMIPSRALFMRAVKKDLSRQYKGMKSKSN